MRHAIIAVTATLLAAPASAAIVFSDNFDAENGGLSALNYTGFANWTVSDGTVDIIAHPGLACRGGAGSCVDLDGSSADSGVFRQNVAIAYAAGETVDVRAWISGNQRGGSDDMFLDIEFTPSAEYLDLVVTINGVANALGDGMASTLGLTETLGAGAAYALWGASFEAVTAGSLLLTFFTTSNDNVGPVLDDVSVSVTPGDPGDVPAPAALALFGLGLVALGAARRR